MKGIEITAVAPNGDVWDLTINPDSTRESLLKELVEFMSLDPSQEYSFRGNPTFPLNENAVVVIDITTPKDILGGSKR